MRSTLTALAVLLCFASIAQVPYERTKVVEVDSVTTAEVLRAKARKWFVDIFKDAKEVIQMDDATTNTIVGKGWTQFTERSGFHFTVEVSCKHGRYRYRIYDVYHKGQGGVYVSGTYAPYPSWGALYDEERCYIPVRSAFQGAKGAEREMLTNCITFRPKFDSRLDAIAASLEAAMQTATAPSSDDW